MKEAVKRLVSLLTVTAVLLTFGMVGSTVFADENRENIITELRNTAEISGVAYSSAEAYGGDWSVHIGYDSGWSEHPIAAKCADFGMKTGEKYDISFYFKGAVESLYITAKSLCIWGNENYIEPPNYPNVGQKITKLENDWYKFEVSDYPLRDAEKALLFTTNGGNNGDIVNNFYLDNLSVIDKASGKELIQNGGFESGEIIEPPPAREDNIIREFYNTTEITGVTYSAEEAQSGDWSVHVKDPENGKGISAKWLDFGLKHDKMYNVRFYLKGNVKRFYVNIGNARIMFDANSPTEPKKDHSTDSLSPTGWATSTFEPAGDGWYYLDWTNAHTGESGNWVNNLPLFSIDPETNDNKGSGDFYLDGLSIKEVDADGNEGTELVQNGGFEPGGTVDPPTPPGPSEPSDGPVRKDTSVVKELLYEEAEAGIAYSSAQAYDGKWSVHVNQAKELAPAPEKFGIEPGKTYNASFYIKGDIGSLYFSFTGSTRVLVTNTEIHSGSLTDIKKVPVEDGWYKIEINNAPAAAADWTPAFLLAEGSPDFYLDKLSVTELDESGNMVRELIENGSFEPPAMEFSDYKIVDGANGEITVSIDVINHSAGENASVQLILAAYSDSFMTACAKNETPTFIEDNDKWVTLTQSIRVNNGDKATAYLWDSVEGMKMLLPSQPLTK